MPLLHRIAEHRTGLAEEADRLRKQLTEVEDELERVVVAQQVVTRLIEEAGEPDERVGGVTYSVEYSHTRRPRRGRPPSRGRAGRVAPVSGVDVPAGLRGRVRAQR